MAAIQRLAEVIEPLHNALEAALRRACTTLDPPPPEQVAVAKAALRREHGTNPRTPGDAT